MLWKVLTFAGMTLTVSVVGVSLVVVFERLFGGVEGVNACGVSAVEEHLGDEFDDLLFGPAVVEGAGDVAGGAGWDGRGR